MYPIWGKKADEAEFRFQRDLYTLQRYSVGSGGLYADVRQEDKKIDFVLFLFNITSLVV